MYRALLLPSAQNDLIDIVHYVADVLQNQQTAYKLADEIINATEILADFPYAYPAYIPMRQTKKEYRKMRVRNYLLFYVVDETEKIVTIYRVVYAKREYDKLLN